MFARPRPCNFLHRANVAECFKVILLSAIGDNSRGHGQRDHADPVLHRHSTGWAAARQARIIKAPSAIDDNTNVPDAGSAFGAVFALALRQRLDPETRALAA